MKQEISGLIKQALEGSSNFETLETLVRDTSLRLGASILETMINSDKNDQHPTFIHPDGTVLDYAGRKEKTFVIVLGDMTLKRAYYTDKNGLGYFPLIKNWDWIRTHSLMVLNG